MRNVRGDLLSRAIDKHIKSFPPDPPFNGQGWRELDFSVVYWRGESLAENSAALVKKYREIGFKCPKPHKIPAANWLFEQVSKHPDYYPSQAGADILKFHGLTFADSIRGRRLLELGCGNGWATIALMRAALRQTSYGISEPLSVDDLIACLPYEVYLNDISADACAKAKFLVSQFMRRQPDRAEREAVHALTMDYHSTEFYRNSFFSRQDDDRLRTIIYWGLTADNEVRLPQQIKQISKYLLKGDRIIILTDETNDIDSLNKSYNNIPTCALMWTLLDTYRERLWCKQPENYLFDLTVGYDEHAGGITVKFIAQQDHVWEREYSDIGPPIHFRQGEIILGPKSIKGGKFQDLAINEICRRSLTAILEPNNFHIIAQVQPPLLSQSWRRTTSPSNITAIIADKLG
jgi:SAM-dependent methyltransferase